MPQDAEPEIICPFCKHPPGSAECIRDCRDGDERARKERDDMDGFGFYERTGEVRIPSFMDWFIDDDGKRKRICSGADPVPGKAYPIERWVETDAAGNRLPKRGSE